MAPLPPCAETLRRGCRSRRVRVHYDHTRHQATDGHTTNLLDSMRTILHLACPPAR